MNDLQMVDDGGEMQRLREEASERYLKEVRGTASRIRRMRAELAEQRELVCGLTGVDYSRPMARTGSYGDAIPDSVAELIEMESAYDAELADLERMRAEARALLDAMGGREGEVLRLYYVSAFPWICVAEVMCMAVGSCKNLRRDALFCFYDYLPAGYKVPEIPAI